jgi:hypothetical protein
MAYPTVLMNFKSAKRMMQKAGHGVSFFRVDGKGENFGGNTSMVTFEWQSAKEAVEVSYRIVEKIFSSDEPSSLFRGASLSTSLDLR